MKTIRMITILLAFLFIPSSLYSQKKVVIGIDTLITITPQELKTINGIIADWEYRMRESVIMDSLLTIKDEQLGIKDSIIVEIQERERIKEEYYLDQSKRLYQENEELKKKSFFKTVLGAGGGFVLGILLAIII